MRGLAAVGTLSVDAATACHRLLEQCIGSEPAKREWILPVAWTAVVAGVTASGRAMFEDTLTLAVLGLLTAAAGSWWAITRPWLERRNAPRQRPWARAIAIGVVAVLTPGLAYLASWLVGNAMQQASVRQFNADRDAFLADPNGFPMLRRLAREQYGVEVVLGDAVQSWALTTLKGPGASPAWMQLRPGYCHLYLDRSNLLRAYRWEGEVDAALLVQGVMLHEFAHCLDVGRDTPALGRRAVETRSVAPVDASGVNDIEGWIEAGSRPATQLWREAVADIMKVGYWRLAAPGAAHDLIAHLRQTRATAKYDTAHATMCWINAAEEAAPPSSAAALFSWADRLRSQAPCELSHRQEPTRAQQWLKSLVDERRP